MPKTGCTHIATILATIFEGEHIGKHNRASDKDIDSQRFFLSSIRNPWDWYLSLWTFGVQGNGGLRNRLTERSFSKSLRAAMISRPRNFIMPLKEPFRDVEQWRNVYDRSDNVLGFRRWLELIHQPCNSSIIGEGYGTGNIAEMAGFMTYRYLFLCCNNLNQLQHKSAINIDTNLMDFDKENCYIDYFVRQEFLEEDLCEGLEKVKTLDDGTKSNIYSKKKINTSNRLLEIGDYYDQSSVDIIGKREQLIISKFNYLPPTLR